VSEQDQSALLLLSELLEINERTRGASLAELRFMVVNETAKFIQYDHAALYEFNGTNYSVSALSGVAEPDKNSIYIKALRSFWRHELISLNDPITTMPISEINLKTAALLEQAELGKTFIAIALFHKEKKIAVLLLSRNKPLSDKEMAVIPKLAKPYGHEMGLHLAQLKSALSFLGKLKKSKIKLALMALVLFALCFPFKSSVLAPSEIIALEPELIRAPIDSVIEDIPVKPNQKVAVGDTLVQFDKQALEAQIDVSKNALKVAEAELRQAAQQSMVDGAARAKISVLKGKVDKEKTNLRYYQDLMTRSSIKAPKAGTVIFEDVFDWLGRPVTVGERIMLLADENQTQIEIHLPVTDAVEIKQGADVLFFSNARPDMPLKATLSFHSYRANKQQEEGVVAYRLKAQWIDALEKQKLKRLGLKGSAKIYTKRQPLIMQALRKPIVKIRQFLGV